jgi:hypothetical protein
LLFQSLRLSIGTRAALQFEQRGRLAATPSLPVARVGSWSPTEVAVCESDCKTADLTAQHRQFVPQHHEFQFLEFA